MKGILKFEDEEEIRYALHCIKNYPAIDDIRNYVRSVLKHGEPSEELCEVLLHIQDLIPWEE